MARKLTARRVFNAGRILSSYYRSRLLGKASHAGMPISVSIEPTTSCNLRCPECPSGLRSFTRTTGMLDLGLYHDLLGQLVPELTAVTFYFQGEPYLHTGLFDMIEGAARMGVYTATSTNGHFLDAELAGETVRSGLDRLIISIDGTTQETYGSYRIGGQLGRVVEGARQVVQWKRKLRSATPHLVFQFLVLGTNEHQVEEIHRLGEDVGVDQVILKTAQIYNYENGSPLIPLQDKYARYRRRADGTYAIKNELLDHCWKMWHSCVMTWDGKVVPCCFDKDAHHVLGDVRKESFREIWHGARYNAFRASLLRSRSEIDICRNCTEGLNVWA